MREEGETAAARLWRDRAENREQERNEALARARLAEATCAVLAAENEGLRLELARLRAFASPDLKQPKTEIEVQMEALRTALLEVLGSSEGFTPKEPGGSNKYGNSPSDLSVKPLQEELRLPPATWDFATAHMNTRATRGR
jgi:hypothetical protein